ncbi:Rv0909 family putative TA system antitoxin [Maridesulfovibrio bastinii]|uniref:Rv0909 family putative TA system antitoxin n=1 Tax=Maridesulfovibrio bastinii TaxID=47157 RepID=UPI000486AB46|nr:Rv0909 family putative TA system antitoxin [Maridesulfovibrio bastinii]
MKKFKVLVFVFCLLSMLTLVAGCQDQEGPAEKAGKKIDQMIDKSGDMAKDLGNKVDESIDDAKESMDK